MPEGKPVKITPVTGRTLLTWVGKRPLSQVTAFPDQHIETFNPSGDAARRAADRDVWADWPDRYPRGGLLFHGDNKEVLAHLLASGFRGKVKIIYIDPPFGSGADYVRRVRLRKGDKAVNRIEVIELRTDPRSGKFFEHKPASAKVQITRSRGQIHVERQDFVSPTITERLSQQAGVLMPRIEDWRAMVDCAMIDPAHNGEVFNVALSDVPPKEDGLVSCTYTLPAPDGETTVAVKITPGEEVLLTERV